jgi:dolichol-phosphate mannosyltransferase
MPTPNTSVAIIVPTLNEADNVAPLVAQIGANTLPISEIVFVDDGSTDGTRERIRALSSKYRTRLVERDFGTRGLAGAIMAGAESTAVEVLVVMDADLSHPPDKISALLQPILDREADLVIGSRYIAGGATPGWPFWRRVISRTASALAYPLTGVRDSMCGFFAIKRECLLHLATAATGFKIAFETIVRGGKKMRVCEVPIVFRDRLRGKSKMSAAEVLRFGSCWLGAVMRRRPKPLLETTILPLCEFRHDEFGSPELNREREVKRERGEEHAAVDLSEPRRQRSNC